MTIFGSSAYQSYTSGAQPSVEICSEVIEAMPCQVIKTMVAGQHTLTHYRILVYENLTAGESTAVK